MKINYVGGVEFSSSDHSTVCTVVLYCTVLLLNWTIILGPQLINK